MPYVNMVSDDGLAMNRFRADYDGVMAYFQMDPPKEILVGF